MFVKPQIMSTPHMVAPLGDAATQACQGTFGTCPSGYTCAPHSADSCVDTSYTNWIVIIGVVGGGLIVGGVIGGAVVAAK